MASRRFGIARGARRAAFAACLGIALLACGEESRPAVDPGPGDVTEASVYVVHELDPFAADMGAWSCSGYMAALRDTEHQRTLERILEIRPHAYREPARLDDVVELQTSFVSEARRAAPVYRHLIHREVATSLTALLRAAEAEGLRLRVQSAFRSPSYQNLLWKLGIRRNRGDLVRVAFSVAPPCFSEHATGRAVDFSTAGSRADFGHSPEYRWLRENGARWNWIQSFREDNGAVKSPNSRGIWVEPWHFHHQSLDP
jgi:D-alanyl-D-alanine carboxypeptidase